jgi:hypothetical protein
MKALVIGSLILVLGIAGTVSSQAQIVNKSESNSATVKTDVSRAGSYEGLWQGVVRTPSGSHRVALDVAHYTTGDTLVANVTTSAQSPFSVLVDTFNVQDNHVRINMRTAGTAFEGTSNRALSEIRGTWKQDGKSMLLTLHRVELNTRSDKGEAHGTQSQLAPSGQTVSSADENPSDPNRRRRKTQVFTIGPPHWFWWYDWTPQIGNQERPYGLYYW